MTLIIAYASCIPPSNASFSLYIPCFRDLIQSLEAGLSDNVDSSNNYCDVILLLAITILTSAASWYWNCTCASNSTCPCV